MVEGKRYANPVAPKGNYNKMNVYFSFPQTIKHFLGGSIILHIPFRSLCLSFEFF